jgi:23S rRNA (cytosine1962-C5)-methyltransferase
MIRDINIMRMDKKQSRRRQDLVSTGWEDYELLDSGNRKKLERFGEIELIRFEPQAIWKPALTEDRWRQVDACFEMGQPRSSGNWTINRPGLDEWSINCHGIHFHLAVGGSRHVGIFPEQLPNWEWLAKTVAEAGRPLSILNLFAYTGGMTAVACQQGARVTHVDSSKSALLRAKRNLLSSGLQDCSVRWIMDDAIEFVRREARRGSHYDGIIMDPPAFGRGPKKQIWKFEESLPLLLHPCKKLVSPKPALFLLTAYNVDQGADDIRQMILGEFPEMERGLQCGQLIQQEKSAGRKIEQAIYGRWSDKLKNNYLR